MANHRQQAAVVILADARVGIGDGGQLEGRQIGLGNELLKILDGGK